jgi:hypothetical protein
MSRKILLVALAVLAMYLVLPVCGGTCTGSDLEILSSSLTSSGSPPYRTYKVVGTAKNVSGHTLSYAQVTVKFYDTNGHVLGSSLDNVNDLGAGERWDFEVVDFGMNQFVYDYKIGAS